MNTKMGPRTVPLVKIVCKKFLVIRVVLSSTGYCKPNLGKKNSIMKRWGTPDIEN